MANGTTVSASVYYSDTTTYTGDAGSETNPYCIEDLYDLINNPYINIQPESEDLYYYYIVVNDIDMNDYVDYKYSPPLGISLYFIKMDFKNHELRNITIYNSTNSTSMFKIYSPQSILNISIYNLKLTNFITYNSQCIIFEISRISFGSPRLYFFNCDFSIYTNTTLPGRCVIQLIMTYDAYSKIYCYNCIFNIKGNLAYSSAAGCIINSNSLYIYYSHIHLYIIKQLYSLISNIGTFTSSYITGDIYGSTCNNNSLIDPSTVSKLISSYVNVNFHNTNPENPTPIYGCNTTGTASCGSVFFINKSKLEGFTACPGTITNYYELTDEECKDVNKLQEIGFLVL